MKSKSGIRLSVASPVYPKMPLLPHDYLHLVNCHEVVIISDILCTKVAYYVCFCRYPPVPPQCGCPKWKPPNRDFNLCFS